VDDLRVLIVADDPLARAGLASLLADRPGLTVVEQTSGDAGRLAEAQAARPDVLLWDLGWDPSATLEQMERSIDLPLAALALLPDPTFAADAWAGGFRGLMLRDADAESIFDALAAVAQGLVVLDPQVAARLAPRDDAAPAPLPEELTPREEEVLQLLAEGLPNKAIALRLEISEHTVKFHVNAILGKLSAQSRTEAVVRATRAGLIVL
jgi:DNA-binding NarL/FixJ family response regulator